MRKHRSSAGMGRIARGLVFGIVAAAAVMMAGGALVAEEEDPELAPQFTLRNLDGVELSLADYLGSVVILDFWASWCHPCILCLPEIHALQEAYADRGVVLLLLCFDKTDDDARDYLLEHGYATENVLWGSLAAVREVQALFGIDSVTHTLVIDRDGYIRYSGHPEKVTADVIEPWLIPEPK